MLCYGKEIRDHSATPAQPCEGSGEGDENATILLVDYFKEKWRAPSERIRTASEIPFEVDLMDEDAAPIHMKISEKVLHW